MGPDPSDKSCKPPKFNVHQINASTSEIAQRQFCPHSSRKCLAKAMSASSVGQPKQNYPQMNLQR
jgi:hypothetical protein